MPTKIPRAPRRGWRVVVVLGSLAGAWVLAQVPGRHGKRIWPMGAAFGAVCLCVGFNAGVLRERRHAASALLSALASADGAWDEQKLRELATWLFAAMQQDLDEGRASRATPYLTPAVADAFAQRCRRARRVPVKLYQVGLVGVDDRPGTADDRCWVWLAADGRDPADREKTVIVEWLWRFDRVGDAWALADWQEGLQATALLSRLRASSAELDEVPATALSRATGGPVEAARGLSLSERV